MGGDEGERTRDTEANGCAEDDWSEDCERWVGEDLRWQGEGWDVGRHCSGLWSVLLVSEVKMNSRFQVYKLKKRQDSRSSSLWQDETKLRWYVIEVEASFPWPWHSPVRHAPNTSMKSVLPTVYVTMCKEMEEGLIAK